MYRTCPRQYEYAAVKKLAWVMNDRESFGSSVHNALKKWGEREAIANGMVPEADQLGLFGAEQKKEEPDTLTQETLLDLWHQSFIVEGFATRMEADFARKRGENLMRRFFDWWKEAKRRVVAVERGFSVSIEELELTGRMDRIEEQEEGLRIVDFKTSRPRSRQEIDADLQLSIYAIACQEMFSKPCTELCMLFLSEDGATEMKTTRSPSQLKDACTQLRLLSERMEDGDFHPTPFSEACRRCPYRNICDASAA